MNLNVNSSGKIIGISKSTIQINLGSVTQELGNIGKTVNSLVKVFILLDKVKNLD